MLPLKVRGGIVRNSPAPRIESPSDRFTNSPRVHQPIKNVTDVLAYSNGWNLGKDTLTLFYHSVSPSGYAAPHTLVAWERPIDKPGLRRPDN